MKNFIKLFNSFLLLIPVMGLAFPGGSGTKDDPYLISNCPELQSIISFPSEYFQLINDIDCNGFDYGDGGGFLPIGNSAYPFRGTLDGNNFTISNLNIYRLNQDRVGLIGQSYDAGVVKNLTVANATITGRDRVGGIVGYADNVGDIQFTHVQFKGTIQGNASVGGLIGNADSNVSIINSHSDAIISATNDPVGGLVGYFNGDSIIGSSAAGEVESTYTYADGAGGLVGYISNGIARIEDSFSSATVRGYTSVGGLIGETAYSIDVINSYAIGEAYGNNAVGGLIGYSSGDIITNSYSLNGAYADHYVGGLIGEVVGSVTVTNSFAAGKVSGDTYAGGLIGYRSSGTPIINNSYWDTVATGQIYSAGGTPKTTEEMYRQDTYVDWNFTSIWHIDEGVDYPRLR